MNIYLWAVVGLGAWSAIMAVAVVFSRAAAKPWPKREQKFRKPPGYGYRPRPHQYLPQPDNPQPPKGGGGIVLPHQRKPR